jgi:uncharacterized membrane protein
VRTLLRHVAEKMRSTLWLLPALLTLAGAGLALALLRLDPAWPLPGLRFAAGPEAAHTVLATIAGSMIGVAGVTFSITIVTLAMASQQMGPRLLRGFVRDRVNQGVFGSFVATFVSALLVLEAIPATAGPQDLPHAAIAGVLLLATLSLAMLLYFIHHTAHSIQADSVVAVVASELQANIRRMYPERHRPGPGSGASRGPEPPRAPEDAVEVPATREGYVQAIHEGRMMQLARRDGLVLDVLRRPGDFVPEGAPILRAWPRSRVPRDFARRASRAASIGNKRTAEQDIEFSIDQLAEVAVRALSPGINDPYTAIRCVDRMGAALAELAQRRFPGAVREDEGGQARMVMRRPSFAGLVAAAFHTVRQAARHHPAVTIRMLEALEGVARRSPRREEVDASVRTHTRLIVAEARKGDLLPDDLADLLRRQRRVEAALRSR